MSTLLTRAQIVQAGLELAGRTDLTTKANRWLNMWLENQYYDFDWNWLIKSSLGNVLTEGMSLPLDYVRNKMFTLGFNNTREPMEVITIEEYNDRLRDANSIGRPLKIYIDQTTHQLYFYPKPDANSYTLDIQYFYMPEPVWGNDSQLLVNAVYVYALKYLDDARYQAERKNLDEDLASCKMNDYDMRGGKHKILLGKSFKRRFGTWRQN